MKKTYKKPVMTAKQDKKAGNSVCGFFHSCGEQVKCQS